MVTREQAKHRATEARRRPAKQRRPEIGHRQTHARAVDARGKRNRITPAALTDRGRVDRRAAMQTENRRAVLKVALTAADLTGVERGADVPGLAGGDRDETHRHAVDRHRKALEVARFEIRSAKLPCRPTAPHIRRKVLVALTNCRLGRSEPRYQHSTDQTRAALRRSFAVSRLAGLPPFDRSGLSRHDQHDSGRIKTAAKKKNSFRTSGPSTAIVRGLAGSQPASDNSWYALQSN